MRWWSAVNPFLTPHRTAWVRLVTSIFSYDGALNFGVAADWDGVPDVDVMAAGIEAGLAEMLAKS